MREAQHHRGRPRSGYQKDYCLYLLAEIERVLPRAAADLTDQERETVAYRFAGLANLAASGGVPGQDPH
jgi:hypothetical protein